MAMMMVMVMSSSGTVASIGFEDDSEPGSAASGVIVVARGVLVKRGDEYRRCDFEAAAGAQFTVWLSSGM